MGKRKKALSFIVLLLALLKGPMGEISNRRLVRKKDKPGGRNERKKIYTVSKEAMDKLVEDSER